MSLTGVIRGKNAVLSFWKNAWVTYMCSSDTTISMQATELPIKTTGQGHWKKVTYQDASYSLTLGGVVVWDDANWTWSDFVDNWLGFVDVRFRLTLIADDNTVKSFQGYVMVQGHDIAYNPIGVAKSSLTLTGNGELQYFDGLIPCDSTISSITVSGQTAADGIVHITYTYTGAPYQVKYRIDATGNYIYALVGTTLDIPGLALGSHSVEIIPVCMNGYEADNSTSQSFVVTQALTCSAVVTDITITTTTAIPVYTGTPSNYKYSIDGGPYVNVGIGFIVPLGGLSVGAHTVTMVPICSNNVEGTGFTKPFTVASQPAQSIINYNWVNFPYAGNVMNIYVNGINMVSLIASSGSGSIIVPTGAVIRALIQSPEPTGARSMSFRVDDTTLGTNLSNQSGASPLTLQYIFTANGDTYFIQGIISP